MNILFLSHRVPFPPDKGDKIRSFHEIRYLSRGHDIFLGTTIGDAAEAAYVEELRKYCRDVFAVRIKGNLNLIKSLFTRKPFTVSYFYSRQLQKYVDDTLKTQRIDAVICFCSGMAEYVFNSAACKSGLNGKLRLVMDFVDLDSDKWRQYASYKRFPASRIYEIEQRRLFDYEMRINRFFHHSVFVSQRETQVFQRQFPDAKNIHVIGNGVNYRYFAPADNKALKRPVRGPILIFTGYMNYFANEDGVDWFCRKILPRVRAEFNDVQFYIVGNKPTAKVQRLGGIEGVHVTGYTADIRQYYHKADVCVIPLRIARGLQNKILEAMATGNAVVATSNAADGIICENGKDILIANSEQEFAESVIELLKNERRRSELGTNAVENVRENYNWDLNLKKLEELLINRQGKDA